MSKGLKGFITYSHEDAAAKDELRKRLAVMEQKNEFTTWHDGEITAGDEWYEDISKNLAEADILLYLVSAASIASKNCNKELAEALKRDIKVIPIILEHCDWMHHQLNDFEVLPLKGKPITKWPDQSEGWQNVVDGVRKAVHETQSQAKPSPNVTPEEIETLAFLAFHRGNFMMILGQIDEALKDYLRAIELSPKNPAAYSNRGAAYISLDKFDKAIVDFSKAIQLNPNNATAYSNRGVAYLQKGDTDLAITDLSEAICLKPDNVTAYSNRGMAHSIKGDFDSALRDLHKSVKLDPCDAAAYNNRGNTYKENGDVELAIRDYNTAIKLKSNDAMVYYNRGTAYYGKGEFDNAIRDYNTAIKLKPDLAEAYNNRGEVWLHLQEWEKAKSDLITAKDMGKDIINTFHKDYASVEAFEQKTGIQLPADIAALLTPPQA